MRKLVFAVVLVAASFVGGAAISNPSGTWDKVRTTLQGWLDSTAPIPSLDENKLVSNGVGSGDVNESSESPSNPQNSRRGIPAAPIPSLVFDGERDGSANPNARTTPQPSQTSARATESPRPQPTPTALAEVAVSIPSPDPSASASLKPETILAAAELPPLSDAASPSTTPSASSVPMPAFEPGEAVVETPILDPDATKREKPRRDPAVVMTSAEMPLDADPPASGAKPTPAPAPDKPAAPAPDDPVVPSPGAAPVPGSITPAGDDPETILPRLSEIDPPIPAVDADVQRTSGDAADPAKVGDQIKGDDAKAPKIIKRDPTAPKTDPELGRAVLAPDVAEKSPVVRVSKENREPKDDDPRMTTWTAVQARMSELNVERFWIEGQSKGKVRFRCVVPLAGESAVSQQFEAEGEDPVKAAAGALRRVALWKATVASQ